MYDHMIIAWDGTAAADHALAWALASRVDGRRHTVLRVVSGAWSSGNSGASGRAEAAARTAVDDEVDRRRAAHPDLTIEGEVVSGDVEDELERRAAPERLLVVGTTAPRESSGRFRFTLGSRIAARAHGPVAVVPETAPILTAAPVLVGIDGTAASFAAARTAATLAQEARLGLLVVHAWQEVGDPDDVRSDVRADLRDVLPKAHRALADEVMTVVRTEFPAVDTELRVVHGPAPAVLTVATAEASLLVVGKHGRITSSSLLLGSVAQSVLLTSTVPVLVVSRHDAAAVPAAAPAAVAAAAAAATGVVLAG